MAESIGMGQAPSDGIPPIPIDDAYLLGISKLQQEFSQRGLNRFMPYSPGILGMEEADILRASQMGRGHQPELDHQLPSDEESGTDGDADKDPAEEN
jgi:hypothetical protein